MYSIYTALPPPSHSSDTGRIIIKWVDAIPLPPSEIRKAQIQQTRGPSNQAFCFSEWLCTSKTKGQWCFVTAPMQLACKNIMLGHGDNTMLLLTNSHVQWVCSQNSKPTIGVNKYACISSHPTH